MWQNELSLGGEAPQVLFGTCSLFIFPLEPGLGRTRIFVLKSILEALLPVAA